MLQPPLPELDVLLAMMGEGLSVEAIRAICKTFGIKQNIF